ncbi:MAG: GAF domain-containing sensor histidine kinase [Bacteroidota bacterium]
MNTTQEIDRLKALDSYSILDTMPDSDYDDLTELAAMICATPIALVTLVDKDRQWFKSHFGMRIKEIPREFSFCTHAIANDQKVFYVRDARLDGRFATNPLVAEEPQIAFYAGVPLVNIDGHALGTLCVIDHEPRDLSEQQLHALSTLGNQAMKLMELRKSKFHLRIANERLERRSRVLERFAEVAAAQINSPLRLIWHATEELKLKWGMDLGDLKDRLKPIQNSVVKLMDLVNGLLRNAKRSEEMDMEKEDILVEQIQQDLRGLYPATSERQLDFYFRMRFVQANSKVLNIFRELVSNAVRHNNKPKAIIEVGGSEDDKYYDFFVSDNGSGMSARVLLHAFEMFTVLNPVGRYGEYSLGRGLPQVKDLVHDLGGMIDIESEEGVGTIVTFSLPK